MISQKPENYSKALKPLSLFLKVYSITLVFELHLCTGLWAYVLKAPALHLMDNVLRLNVFVNWRGLLLILFHESFLFIK